MFADHYDNIYPAIFKYRVISGKFKGREVWSFTHAGIMHPNAPIATYDDEAGYVMFAGELELIEEPEYLDITKIMKGDIE